MLRRFLTEPHKEFIMKNYLLMSSKKMGDVLNINRSTVQRFLKVNGFVISAELREKFRVEGLTGKTSFTELEDKFIIDNYLTMPVKTIAANLNRSGCGIIISMKRLGLSIPSGIIAQRKIESRFSKGSIPINKGKRQVDYMTAEAITRTSATRFKKGNIPHNCYNEVGKISIRKGKSGTYYQHKCIAVGVWRLLHQLIWEEHNGPIPKGHIVRFIDGDSTRCVIENLKLITKKEHRALNASYALLKDSTVARYLVGKNGDPSTVEDIPELLELKRNQIKLNRAIKHEQTAIRG